MEQRFKIETFFEKGYTLDKEGNVFNPKGKIVKGYIQVLTSGYKRKEVSIRINDTKVNIRVHRLQAYKKYGCQIFQKDLEIRHLDNDSLNNSWKNIEIGSRSENAMDKPEKLRIKVATNATRTMQNNIRSYEERCLIYDDLKNEIPYNEILKRHNLNSKGTLSFMKNKSIEYKEYLKK